MKRIKMTVAYDGTGYCGWQLQPNGVTIEEILNGTLSELLKEPVCVIGASRTDSGVHALGNVAVFDTESRIPGEKLCYAVNQKLPEDIRVLESEEVPLDWHPRKQNSVKTYEYKILNCRISVPTRRLYAHFCYYSLDVEKMRQGAAYLLGEHDFSSFCSSGHQAEETVRTLYDISVDRGTDDHHPVKGQRIPLQHGPDHCRDFNEGGHGSLAAGACEGDPGGQGPEGGWGNGPGQRAHHGGDRI